MIFNISGDIVSNDDAVFYKWFGWDATCPKHVRNALANLTPGEKFEVKINSGGGSVFAGKEIYSILRGRDDVEIEIESIAGSAASVIAMANKCKMSPVATLMIHNVSIYGAGGDYRDMDKYSEILRNENETLANAYCEKTGKEKQEILDLMNQETWLSAQKAVELGFVDGIIESNISMSASIGMRLTDELRSQAKAQMEEAEKKEKAMLDEIARKKDAILSDLDMFGI
ncbi:MAG: Clp protease ClpP [Lachnospiraceae bacterium]|nr:Clp protease ClpP [Lachnospiraceae bacterium]